MAFLSIILPVYNGERYLKKCIESVLSQSFGDFELLCVDDGSTDDSYKTCINYANYDKRVRIFSKQNGGVGSARNVGIQNAIGELVTFVDQDDWVDKEMYATVVRNMVDVNADMGVCGFWKEYQNESIRMINKQPVPYIISDINDYIKFAFFREKYRNFAAYIWNKVFSMRYIKERNLLFNESIRRGDDIQFYTEYALVSEKCVYNDSNFYHYSINEKSVSHTQNANNIAVLSEILDGYEKSIKCLNDDYRVLPESVDFLKSFHCYHASLLHQIAANEKLDNLKEIYRKKALIYLDEYKNQNSLFPERIKAISEIVVD